MNAAEFRPGHRNHLSGGIQLHGTAAQRDHGAVQRQVDQSTAVANQAVEKAGQYAYRDRRTRKPGISGLERVSKPGRRIYAKRTEIPWVLSGLGVAILSTPKGVMSGQRARQLGVGGEILCKVW